MIAKSIIYDFSAKLIKDGLNAVSVKHYLSDLELFTLWSSKNGFCLKPVVGSQELKDLFNSRSLSAYRNYLFASPAPPATANRYFASLRRFLAFCRESGFIEADLSPLLANLDPEATAPGLVANFENYLAARNLSSATVRNYANDASGFLYWLEKQ